jgi:hypothetical protein
MLGALERSKWLLSHPTRVYADSIWFQSYLGCSFFLGPGPQKPEKAPKGAIFENSEKTHHESVFWGHLGMVSITHYPNMKKLF